MKSKNHDEHYPLATEALFRVFTDPAFYEERYTSDRTRHQFIELGERDGQFIIDVRQFLIVDHARMPALLRKLARNENVLHTRMVWELKPGADGSYRGTHSLHVDGVPVNVKGSMKLVPEGAGCVNHLRLDISSSIPLIGGKIAEFIAGKAEGALVKNYQHTRRYLAARGLVPA